MVAGLGLVVIGVVCGLTLVVVRRFFHAVYLHYVTTNMLHQFSVELLHVPSMLALYELTFFWHYYCNFPLAS